MATTAVIHFMHFI